MDIDKLITTAKNSYQTNKYRSYRECYNDGVLVLADLIRQQLLQQTPVSGRSEQLPPVVENRLLPAVLWSYIGVDDFIFRHGDYCLRVEKMDKGYYWWCVYYKDEYAGFDEPRAKTEKEAKLLAELCFIRHIVEHGA